MLEMRVNRWQHALGVPRHWTAAQADLAARDVAAHTEEIATELAQAIEPWLDDDAVIVLPRVAIDARFDPRNDWHLTCRSWAQQLARQLAVALRDPACGAVRFASRAEYAARYIAARARGSADRWWFASFAGLHVLPVAAAIRTVLTHDAAPGLAILAALADAESKEIAAALGPDEAMRVLSEWCAAWPSDGGSEASLVEAIERLSPHDPSPVAYRALRALAQRAPGTLPAPREAAALLFAAALLQGAQCGASPGELRALGEGREEALKRWAATGLARALREVAAHVDDAVRETLRKQLAKMAAKAPAPTPLPQQSFDTSFGGVAWLLYALNDFLGDIVPSFPWPRLEGATPAGALSLAVACAAFPPSRSLALWHDDAWRALLGIEPRFDESALHEFLRDADAAAQAWSAAWPSMLLRWASRTMLLRRSRYVDRDSGLWLTQDVAERLPGTDAPEFSTRLALTRATQRESRFLDANEFTRQLPVEWQCTILPAAQAALRRLAYRIPGMAWTSAAHLHANVLDVRARVHVPAGEGAPWRVQVARPLLDVLLTMTGLSRAKFDVLPGRTVVLDRLEGG